WRGLAAGVVEAGVRRFRASPGDLLAWLGPAIGAQAYEVGDDVRAALGMEERGARAFTPHRSGKWHLDLYAVARARLAQAGVRVVAAAATLLLLSDRLRERLMPALVSFAIGTLLGAAFLAILPHALESGVGAHAVALTVLLSLLGFFLLEKMVLWRHCHTYDC